MKENMKLKIVGSLVILSVILFNCGGKKDDPTPGSTVEVGTFVGNMIVADDPQTESGYITNVKVSISVTGKAARIKITGDPSFDRTFTGTVISAVGTTYDISIDKQTLPNEKIAGTRLIVSNNKATITLDVANDEVNVKSTPNSSTTISITGKIQFIGAELLKQ